MDDVSQVTKKRRTVTGSMSTPMPGRGPQPFSPGVSFVHPVVPSRTVQNGQAESVASDITIDSGLGGGLSPVLNLSHDDSKSGKKHKKKKKKHKDDKSVDMCDSNVLQESDSKEHKRKTVKDEAASNTVEDSGGLDTSKVKKHKKHKDTVDS